MPKTARSQPSPAYGRRFSCRWRWSKPCVSEPKVSDRTIEQTKSILTLSLITTSQHASSPVSIILIRRARLWGFSRVSLRESRCSFPNFAPRRVRPHARSTKKATSRSQSLYNALVGRQGVSLLRRRPLRRQGALRAALVNAYAFPQLRALSGSTPCEVNKKDGQPKLTVLTCFGGPSGGRTLDLGIKSPLLYQLS